MHHVIAVLDPRYPERALGCDPSQMMRALVFRFADEPDTLAAVTLYPNAVAVAYAAGHMSIEAGSAGRAVTVAFAQWLRGLNADEIATACITRSQYDAMLTEKAFDTHRRTSCSDETLYLVRGLFTPASVELPRVVPEWTTTNDGALCTARATNPITAEPMTHQISIGTFEEAMFEQGPGALVGISSRSEIEQSLKDALHDQVLMDRMQWTARSTRPVAGRPA